MNFNDLVQSLNDQLAAVAKAPIPFLAVVGIVGWLLWRLARSHFSIRLENAESTVAMLRERLDRSQVTETSIAVENLEDRRALQPIPTTDRPAPDQPSPRINDETGEFSASMSFADITAIFETHTNLQAQRLVAPLIGTWATVEGGVFDVSPLMDGRALLSLRYEAYTLFSFVFEREEEVAHLAEGQRIRVQGKFLEVHPTRLTFTDAQIVG